MDILLGCPWMSIDIHGHPRRISMDAMAFKLK
jgi:hypothetical protein